MGPHGGLFHKMRGSSRLAEELLASVEGFWFMAWMSEWVSQWVDELVS
jgi:hypothetical protein